MNKKIDLDYIKEQIKQSIIESSNHIDIGLIEILIEWTTRNRLEIRIKIDNIYDKLSLISNPLVYDDDGNTRIIEDCLFNLAESIENTANNQKIEHIKTKLLLNVIEKYKSDLLLIALNIKKTCLRWNA